jgi:predicted metalloprotease
MRLDDLPESSSVEDRRSDSSFSNLPMSPSGLGIGGVIVLGLIGWALGIDPSLLITGFETLQRQNPQSAPTTQQRPTSLPNDEMGRLVTRVLGSNEARWSEIMANDKARFSKPILVLYKQQTQASCGGIAQASMGPFYCPSDKKIYLDTSFFDQIATRFRGCDVGSKSCQFAYAYVIAHEFGHHIQNLLGILAKADQAQRNAASKAAANRIQVQVELQADCFAGVWANAENRHLKSQGKQPFIEAGDVEAALRTAAAIGDDTLQKKAKGYVVPDSFTHGTSEQRQRWFNTGFNSGKPESCNTFAAAQL